jgi:hypothetical protein
MTHTTRMQNTVHRLIKRWGKIGYLRRDGVDRPAHMVLIDVKPRDRDLVEEGSKLCAVSVKGLNTPPDRDADVVVFAGVVYRISSPVRALSSDGVTAYYEFSVLYDSTESSPVDAS